MDQNQIDNQEFEDQAKGFSELSLVSAKRDGVFTYLHPITMIAHAWFTRGVDFGRRHAAISIANLNYMRIRLDLVTKERDEAQVVLESVRQELEAERAEHAITESMLLETGVPDALQEATNLVVEKAQAVAQFFDNEGVLDDLPNGLINSLIDSVNTLHREALDQVEKAEDPLSECIRSIRLCFDTGNKVRANLYLDQAEDLLQSDRQYRKEG